MRERISAGRAWLTTLLIFCASVLPAQAQQARLMGAVKNVTEQGQQYQQYTVKCGTIEERKLVWRKLGAAQWCGKLVSGFCAEDRVSAAHLVCSSGYFSALEVSNRSAQVPERKQKSAQQVALEDEQRSIEAELLKIEAKKIELRNRELELLRAEANL